MVKVTSDKLKMLVFLPLVDDERDTRDQQAEDSRGMHSWHSGTLASRALLPVEKTVTAGCQGFRN